MNSFRLALRVLRVDRRTRTSALLTAGGIAVATTLALLLLGLPYATEARADRAAWQEPAGLTDVDPAAAPLLMTASTDVVDGTKIARVDFALTGDYSAVTLPPGVDRLPGPGEALLSPALAARADGLPGSQLGERFGTKVGLIGSDALRDPDQLVALVGHAPSDLTGTAVPASGFATEARYTDETLALLAGVGLVVLIVPSLVLIASAARLTASRREQRLSALRLAGATPRQIMAMVIAELTFPVVAGVALGLALGPPVRTLAAQVPWEGGTWFADDLAAPIGLTVAAAVGLPLLVLVAAAAGLRRVVATPLGAASGQRAKPVHWWRLAALPAAGLAFFAAVQGDAGSTTVLVALAAMIGSAAIVGPWLTAATGRFLMLRWRGPAGLLAGRRLESDPKSAYRASAGVVLAVFVGSMALTLLPTFESYDVSPPDGPFPGSTLTLHTDPKHADAAMSQANANLKRYGQNERAVRLAPGDALIDPAALPDGVRPLSSIVAVPTKADNHELVRTALVAAAAGARVDSAADYRDDDRQLLGDLRRVTLIGLAAAGLLAGCSVAITTAGSVMDRRRTFGALIAAGTPPPTLARMLRVEAALPAVIATLGAGAAGSLAGVGLYSLVSAPSDIVLSPWLAAPVVVGIAVALLAASTCGPMLRRVREEPLSDE